jgi:hypothetical protein
VWTWWCVSVAPSPCKQEGFRAITLAHRQFIISKTVSEGNTRAAYLAWVGPGTTRQQLWNDRLKGFGVDSGRPVRVLVMNLT